MPIKRCNSGGKPGYKYGDSGKCYVYTPGNESSRKRARNKAARQGRAIERSKSMAAHSIPSTINLTAPVDIQAAEGEDDKLATFKMNAYTGGKMNVDGFYDPVVIDLAGLKPVAEQLPALLNHSMAQVVGHIDSIGISSRTVKASGVISGAGPAAAEVKAAAKNGFPWQASVGAKIVKAYLLEEGDKANVNGYSIKGPAIIATATELKEISFVPLGADSKTSATVAASFDSDSPSIGVTSMKFEEFVAALGLNIDDLTDDQKASLQAKYDEGARVAPKEPAKKPTRRARKKAAADVNAAASTGDDDVVTRTREKVAAEEKRMDDIRALSTKPEFTSIENISEIKAKAINEGWTVDQFELECRRQDRPAPDAGFRPHSVSQPDNLGDILKASLLRSCSMPDEMMQQWFDEKTLEAADSSRYRGCSVHMLFDSCIAAAGKHFSGNRRSSDYITAAFQADIDIRANEGFSTVSVSQILEDAAHKQLIVSYQAQETVWDRFCAAHSLTDFKPHNRYRLDSEGSFRKIPADGEIKHVGLSDDKYTKQLDTYGAIIALNRQMIINDDLDSFMQVPRLLGRMAAVRLEEEVFKTLLSNPGSFFSAGNRNLITSAFGLDALSEAENKFLDQVDSNGKPILISPQVLLVPTTLRVDSQDVYAQTTVDTMITDGSAGRTIGRNPHKGKYPPVVSPYLNNTAITDQDGEAIPNQSGTGWYLFADPAVRAAMAVGLLNGSRVPLLESAQTDFNTLGMQWRAYHDFGIGMEDPVAAVFSDGTV